MAGSWRRELPACSHYYFLIWTRLCFDAEVKQKQQGELSRNSSRWANCNYSLRSVVLVIRNSAPTQNEVTLSDDAANDLRQQPNLHGHK